MNNEYNILSKEWNGKPRTVLSYTKQIKLYKLIIQQYPTPKDLKEKLLSMDNSNAQILGYYINEDWNEEHYKKFILANIVKYTNIGKFIISNLIGATAGTISGYLLNKHLYDKSNSEILNNFEKIKNINTDDPNVQLNDDQIKAIMNIHKLNNIQNQQKMDHTNIKNYYPYALGVGVKGLTSYSTYKLLDALDKKSAKKNA
jgi:hypothetical protein